MRAQFGEAWDLLFDPPIAHRGLWRPDGAPENSLGAFQAACAAGYSIELDVHLSADGDAVVFHDDTLKRMTGLEGRIRDRTVEELAAIPLAGTDETIPTLTEALTLIGNRAMVHIELKTPFGEVGPLEQRVHEIISDHHGPLCIIGFNPYAHAWYADRHPGVLRGLDSWAWARPKEMAEDQRRAYRNLEQLEIARPHFLALGLDVLPHPRATELRAQGMPLIAWTIRQPSEWDAVRDGCDNLIFEGFIPQDAREGAKA